MDIDYIDSKDPNRKYNPPALAYNGTSCKDHDGCVILHYGYNQLFSSSGTLGPGLFSTHVQLRDLNGLSQSQDLSMASPILGNSSGGGVTQYLVVYHEQTDAVNPFVVIGMWTEFRLGDGATTQARKSLRSRSATTIGTKNLNKKLKNSSIVQTQPQPETLSFSNSDNNPGSITISNTRVLRSATQIPLEKLNAIDLPPTDPRFVPVPSADGTIDPGETTTAIDLPAPPLASTKKAMTWIINTVVNYAGKTYVQARYDKYTDPYAGDTSISEARSLLWIRKPAELVNNPIPNFTQSILTPGGAEKNSWSGGELFAIANVVGSSLLSSADADAKCQTAGQDRYGLSGFRMAEFHDGSAPNAGWGFWAQSDDPNLSSPGNRYWVKINDQNANPW